MIYLFFVCVVLCFVGLAFIPTRNYKYGIIIILSAVCGIAFSLFSIGAADIRQRQVESERCEAAGGVYVNMYKSGSICLSKDVIR